MNYKLPEIDEINQAQQRNNKELEIKSIRIIEIQNQISKHTQIYIPTIVQLIIKNFTQINFDKLNAKVNGILQINFIISTDNKYLQKTITNILYWTQIQQKAIRQGNIEQLQRKQSNYILINFNKDLNIKLPIYHSEDVEVTAKKMHDPTFFKHQYPATIIKYTIRKEFDVSIFQRDQFFVPFSLIQLNLQLSIQNITLNPIRQQGYSKLQRHQNIQTIGFNILRLESAMVLDKEETFSKERTRQLAPMITYQKMQPFGEYDLAKSAMQAYSHDDSQVKDMHSILDDQQPLQLRFKPFKYAFFIMPIYKFLEVDLLMIFIPTWVLSFISIYLFFEDNEINDRITNVASLMIAYATVQPIIRQNIPNTPNLTLIDCLIYSELIPNVLFIVKTFEDRRIDEQSYDFQWQNDPFFLVSLAIGIINPLIIILLAIKQKFQIQEMKMPQGGNFRQSQVRINHNQPWSLKLLDQRLFARYSNKITYLPQRKKPSLMYS